MFIPSSCESNIKEWEKVESDGDKLGRENLFNWHRMGSATLQFIRSVCEGFGKEACEKSGKPKELAAFIKKPVFLTSFKHNRFNIPFINSTFCIFHLQDILNFLKTLSKDKNKLMKSIEADGNDIIIVAATTAMSILEMHITTPLMKLMNKNDVNVVEISNYYTCLQDKLKIWSIDPLELLNGSAVLFEDIPPNKNEIYKYVYESFCDNDLIRQALAVGCKSFLIVTERMLADHLPGGKFNDPSIQIQNETKSVPKHNIACERFFSGLDRLVRKMPTANTIGIEGILLWSLNETSDYLDNIDKKERELIISAARKQTPDILKKYRARKALIKSKTEEKVIVNANLVARKEQNLQINKNKLIQFVNTNGGPVNCK
jgi:E1A/CREB-binding protein